jgi:hypothetical protein
MARGEQKIMSKYYEAFLADPDRIPDGKEIRLFVKDLTPGPRKYDTRFVKAKIFKAQEPMSSSDTLRLRFLDGKLHSTGLAILILEDIGESVPGPPYALHTGLFSENE